MNKFASCLSELEKSAGLGDAIKRIALTEVPGTKPWFIGGKKPLTDGLKSGAGKTIGKLGPTSTKRTANGAYDVSEMAKKMGIT